MEQVVLEIKMNFESVDGFLLIRKVRLACFLWINVTRFLFEDSLKTLVNSHETTRNVQGNGQKDYRIGTVEESSI